MAPKKITVLFIVGLIAVTAFYDVYIFMKGGTEATISWVIFEWAHLYPAIPFAIGFLCGHLFWQQKSYQKFKDNK